ncbi:blast:Peritrophin-1 [Drosophila guanche]|uniref:Blast:Peritrophin-1 n=1 Tax=Drosophila guanche TaxID=7266 RepID=A0A3B0KLI6_DROGU|nr:blast:Peritrophin-1 [Drosophila guanche]
MPRLCQGRHLVVRVFWTTSKLLNVLKMRNTDLCALWTLLLVAAATASASASASAGVCLYELDGTRLPVSTHCGRFAVCQHGEVAAIGSCPRGLHFNRELAECDFQWRANCLGLSPFAGADARADADCTCTCCADECPNTDVDGPGLTTLVTEPCNTESTTTEPAVTGATNPTEPTNDDDSDETTESNETTTDEATTDTNNAVNTTPSSPSAVPTYCSSQRDECANVSTNAKLEIPGVCGKYIQCSNRCVNEISCPSGLYFNPSSGDCDYPWNVECTPALAADSTEEIEGPSGTTCASQGVCAGKRDGTLLADPDTNGYFVCQCQCPIAMPCDEYTKFNQTAQVCDWDWSDESAAVVCPDGLVYNVTSNECDYPEGYVPEVVCNSTSTVCQGEAEGTLFPVDGVCNKFYKCNFNCAVEQLCPNNLLFDATTEICDYPQNVECQWPHTPPSGPNAGPSGIACESNGRCLNAREGTYLPSETSCNGYVICQCECEVELACPEGLYWDEDLLTCNYATNVKCNL